MHFLLEKDFGKEVGLGYGKAQKGTRLSIIKTGATGES